MRMRLPAVFLAMTALAGSGCIATSLALNDRSTPARKKAGICLLAGLAELLISQVGPGEGSDLDFRPLFLVGAVIDLTAAGLYGISARGEEHPAPETELGAVALPVDIAWIPDDDMYLADTRALEPRSLRWCLAEPSPAARAGPPDGSAAATPGEGEGRETE